jgi:hypothetical protein
MLTKTAIGFSNKTDSFAAGMEASSIAIAQMAIHY